MKTIRLVKFYQGVLLSGSTLTSFQPDEVLSDAGLRKGYKAEVVPNGVEVSDPTMTCLVPWNNVAYVQFIEASGPKQATKSK